MPAARLSPVWLVLIGILSVQFGAAVSKGQFDEIPPIGMVLLRLAGGCWALYIVSIAATRRRWEGLDGLAVASTVATLAITPFAVATAGARLLGSVIPHTSRWSPAARCRLGATRTTPARDVIASDESGNGTWRNRQRGKITDLAMWAILRDRSLLISQYGPHC